MNYRPVLFLLLFSAATFCGYGQKQFTEGVLVYKVKLESEDHKVLNGTYTYTIKGNQVKKELKVDNGYHDILLLNCGSSTIYSLQSPNGQHFAVELSMEDLRKRQEKYSGYSMAGEEITEQKIAGCPVAKADVKYNDGSKAPVLYTKDWYPTQSVTFDRFPDAKFIPLKFSYKDEHGITMEFEAERIDAIPVENAVFRIPRDYRVISYKEYKQLNR